MENVSFEFKLITVYSNSGCGGEGGEGSGGGCGGEGGGSSCGGE
ncbi:hypothetical protein [Pelosinus baikalensis]|nr:hypothetical protein [Pelosinus baikalensis]